MKAAMVFVASIISTGAGFATEPSTGTGLAGPSTPPSPPSLGVGPRPDTVSP